MTPIQALTAIEQEESRRRASAPHPEIVQADEGPVPVKPVTVPPPTPLPSGQAVQSTATPTAPTVSTVPGFLRRVEAELEAEAKKILGG